MTPTHLIVAVTATDGAAVSPVRTAARWLRRIWLRSCTRRELEALSNSDLCDIGLTRGEIDYVANAAADAALSDKD